jgi:hypothetical protein
VLDLAGFVHHRDVGVAERRGRAGLGQQPLRGIVAGRAGAKRLERHDTAQLQIFGAVHVTHAAGAEMFEHAIVRQRLADHRPIIRLLRVGPCGFDTCVCHPVCTDYCHLRDNHLLRPG